MYIQRRLRKQDKGTVQEPWEGAETRPRGQTCISEREPRPPEAYPQPEPRAGRDGGRGNPENAGALEDFRSRRRKESSCEESDWSRDARLAVSPGPTVSPPAADSAGQPTRHPLTGPAWRAQDSCERGARGGSRETGEGRSVRSLNLIGSL